MPCVWLSPLTYTIAEFNPNAITHLGDLFIPFLNPFSAYRFESIEQILRNRILNKNANVYPWYMHISSLSSRRCAYK